MGIDLPYLGFGLGLRSEHCKEILAGHHHCQWFEALTENYMGMENVGQGQTLETLKKIRSEAPVVLHGVSLNIGAAEPLNQNYLSRLIDLQQQIQPLWISDHVCWTGLNGKNTHDLLPLPYNEEVIQHVAQKVLQVQDLIKQPLVLENVSSYIQFKSSTMHEWEFLSRLVELTDCKLLVDINNIFVSAHNHSFNPHTFIDGLPPHAIQQFHLAGPSKQGEFYIDTHDHPVLDEVWQLFKYCAQKFPPISTMIEWDANVPPLDQLEAELLKAKTYAQPYWGHAYEAQLKACERLKPSYDYEQQL